jgi:hypothetical protein
MKLEWRALDQVPVKNYPHSAIVPRRSNAHQHHP